MVAGATSGRIGRHEVSLGNLIMGGDGGETTPAGLRIVSLDPIRLVFDMQRSGFPRLSARAQEGKLASTRDEKLRSKRI